MCRPLSYMWYDLRADERRDHPEYVEQGPPPMIEALHLRLKDSSSTHVTPKELEGFSVDISRVQTSDDEVHFSPCFFRPNLVNFLRDFPLLSHDDDRYYTSDPPSCPPTAKAFKRLCEFNQEVYRERRTLRTQSNPKCDCSILTFNDIVPAM